MKPKTFYVRAAAAAAAALLFLYPFPAHAADSAALQGQVSAAQREYESAASTLDSMQQQASDTRQQVNDLQSQTDALRGQLGSIVAQLEQSRTELAEAQNQATAAAKALEEKQAAFSARYDSCKQQLTAMQLLNEGGKISLLMQADDLYELLTFWQVLNDLTEHRCCRPRCHNPKYAHKSVLYQRPVPDFEKAVPQYQIPFLQDRHAYRQRTSNVPNSQSSNHRKT